MDAPYHREIMQRALGRRVSARALQAMTAANLGQDSLRNLLRQEFHFDHPYEAASLRYIETCRAQAAASADAPAAWAAFGRLTHCAQDFYAHSNYVSLWLHERKPWPTVAEIDGLDPAILRHPALRSARVYWVREALWLLPALRPLVRPLLPSDAHALINLDAPAAGPLFPYAIAAAVQRTVAEFERTLALIGEMSGEEAMRRFEGEG